MGIATRIPYADTNFITAAGQNANEDSLMNAVNNIENANCADTMALRGHKLADSPNGITTTKINDLQVTGAKIALSTIDTSRMKGYSLQDIAIGVPAGANQIQGLTFCWTLTAGNYILKLTTHEFDGTYNASQILSFTPSPVIPEATKIILGSNLVFTSGVLGTGAEIVGYVRCILMDKT
jgi:hypothetical protein